MSRNIPGPLLDYMSGNATELCLITKVGPFPDDSYKHFADLDENVPYNGDTYYARTGVQFSALVSTADLQVDNMEMDSLPPVNGHEIEGFSVDDIRSGVIDGVRFETYLVNYTDLSKGVALWAGGTIGEVRIKGTALINFEGRSISNRFKQNIVESGSTTCRVKHFGSVYIGTDSGEPEERQPCLYDTTSEWVPFTVGTVDGDDGDRLFTTDRTEADDYFAPGKVRMLTGDNAGLMREVGAYSQTDGTVGLDYPFPKDLNPGDTGEISRECSRHYTGHNSCDTFHGSEKTLRFRGEPHKPLGDAGQILTPGAGSPTDIGGTGEQPTGNPTPPVTPPSGGTGTPGTAPSRTIGADIVDACDHGADPSASAASNVSAFNAAIAALASGGGEVYCSVAGTYNVTVGNTSNLIVLDRNNTWLNLDGVVLKAAHSTTTTTSSNHRDVIRVDGATQWKVSGGAIIGYLDTWVTGGGASAYGISEWAHGIYVTDSASAGNIEGITISKCVGDGISIGRSASDIYVGDVVITNCRRQGISTGGDNITIEEFDISYIGTTSPPANGPWAGIDVEVDSPESATNITIRNGRTYKNKGPGILAVVRTSNITIFGVTSEDNQNYGMLFSNSDTGSVKGCTLQHNKYVGTKFENDSDGWTVGGSASNSADKNTYFNNNTSMRGRITTGSTSALNGESNATKDHIYTEDGSAVTVLWNDLGP